VSPVTARERSATLLGRLEPLVPLVLAVHGAAVLLPRHRSAAGVAGVTLVCLLAVTGLLGWRTDRDRRPLRRHRRHLVRPAGR
jgi:hypothetical protein